MRSPVNRSEIRLVEERLNKVLGAFHVIENAIAADEEADRLFTQCLDIFDQEVVMDDEGATMDERSRQITLLAKAITDWQNTQRR